MLSQSELRRRAHYPRTSAEKRVTKRARRRGTPSRRSAGRLCGDRGSEDRTSVRRPSGTESRHRVRSSLSLSHARPMASRDGRQFTREKSFERRGAGSNHGRTCSRSPRATSLIRIRDRFASRRHACLRHDSSIRQKWVRADSNHRETVAHSVRAAARWARIPHARFRRSHRSRQKQWVRADSNHRPSPCKGDVMTTRPRTRTS